MRIAFGRSVLLSGAAWCALSLTAVGQTPRIEVEFQMEPLPETLDLENPESERAQAIAAELQSEAISLLQAEFPFIQWIPALETNGEATEPGAGDEPSPPQPKPVTRLRFVMKAELGIAERVYIECWVRKKSGPTKLDFTPPDVYFGSNYPTPSEVVTTTVANGKTVLRALIGESSGEWQEQLTKRIPLANRLEPREDRMLLIVPLMPAQLKASGKSVVLAVFFEDISGGPSQPRGKIEMQPQGALIDPDDELSGMQALRVALFDYHPHTKNGWHEEIPMAVANHMPEKIRVFMQEYIPAEEDPIIDEF